MRWTRSQPHGGHTDTTGRAEPAWAGGRARWPRALPRIGQKAWLASQDLGLRWTGRRRREGKLAVSGTGAAAASGPVRLTSPSYRVRKVTGGAVCAGLHRRLTPPDSRKPFACGSCPAEAGGVLRSLPACPAVAWEGGSLTARGSASANGSVSKARLAVLRGACSLGTPSPPPEKHGESGCLLRSLPAATPRRL